MSAAAELPKRNWTGADLEARPDDGDNHKLVNGELVVNPQNNFEHENLCGRLFLAGLPISHGRPVSGLELGLTSS